MTTKKYAVYLLPGSCPGTWVDCDPSDFGEWGHEYDSYEEGFNDLLDAGFEADWISPQDIPDPR